MTPRLVPDVALPPYAFVPGQAPHPQSDPAGHRYGADLPAPEPLDPARWRDSLHYVLGIDLFNHGYPWEAHERWEALWHVHGRRGLIADFLKALIQLAAAEVKAREGRPDGVRTHAARAAELAAGVRQRAGAAVFAGLGLDALVAAAGRLSSHVTPGRVALTPA